MPKSQKPKKKHQHVDPKRLMNQQLRFATIDRVIRDLESGELNEINGVLAYYDMEREDYYPLLPTLATWIYYVELLAGEENVRAHTIVLHLLENDEELTPELVQQMKVEVAKHKHAYLKLTPEQARDVALTARIKIQEHRAGELNKPSGTVEASGL